MIYVNKFGKLEFSSSSGAIRDRVRIKALYDVDESNWKVFSVGTERDDCWDGIWTWEQCIGRMDDDEKVFADDFRQNNEEV